MRRIRLRQSPAFIVAVLALVAAVSGAAVAQPAAKKAVTSKKAKQIAINQINKLALPTDGVRYVKINADGTIASALAKGVTQANVTTGGAGNYCISGLDPAPLDVQASPAFSGTPFGNQWYVEINPTIGPCAGKQAWIATYNSANTSVNSPTYVALF